MVGAGDYFQPVIETGRKTTAHIRIMAQAFDEWNSSDKMKADKLQWSRWCMVVVYAAAMAWVESAVVFYLRSMMDRIEPYQRNPLPVIGGFAQVELPRELATMVMLFAVGWLAGKDWRARLGYSAIAFGVWDIGYYGFLKVMCGWPHSLLDWDVLFLLPVPWWGPVLAPILISLLMILWGTIASRSGAARAPAMRNLFPWILNIAGMGIALYTFMADSFPASLRGSDAVRNLLPVRFNWLAFGLALILMSAPVIESLRRTRLAVNRNFCAVEELMPHE